MPVARGAWFSVTSEANICSILAAAAEGPAGQRRRIARRARCSNARRAAVGRGVPHSGIQALPRKRPGGIYAALPRKHLDHRLRVRAAGRLRRARRRVSPGAIPESRRRRVVGIGRAWPQVAPVVDARWTSKRRFMHSPVRSRQAGTAGREIPARRPIRRTSRRRVDPRVFAHHAYGDVMSSPPHRPRAKRRRSPTARVRPQSRRVRAAYNSLMSCALSSTRMTHITSVMVARPRCCLRILLIASVS
jgi:hypothetical protein